MNVSFQCCASENKERSEESYRGKLLFLLSDSDTDTNRHQSDDVISPKFDLTVTMVMSCCTRLLLLKCTRIHAIRFTFSRFSFSQTKLKLRFN